MFNNEINLLLKKADELRSLFILGQKVIPFLEEIFVFVSEIQPLLDEINKSITENLRRMPNASRQLSKVTEATELATNDIMDLVDGILFNVETISSNLNKFQIISDIENVKPLQILEIVYKAIESGSDVREILPELRVVIDNLKGNIINENNDTILQTREIVRTIQEDSTSIMISLQVQDITSQQIAAVNKLLETVQIKLESILQHFRDSELNEMVIADDDYIDSGEIKVSKLHRDIAFDPHAVDSIANKGFRQSEVDEYIRIANEEGLDAIEENTSQDEINNLFDKNEIENQENIKNEPVAVKKPEMLSNLIAESDTDNTQSDDFEAISQEDIDKMFN